eukprot:s1384_g9.t1
METHFAADDRWIAQAKRARTEKAEGLLRGGLVCVENPWGTVAVTSPTPELGERHQTVTTRPQQFIIVGPNVKQPRSLATPAAVAMGFGINLGAGCWRLQALLECLPWCQRRDHLAPRRERGAAGEAPEAKVVPVLFFSGEEVAKIQVSPTWTTLEFKKAIGAFLTKGVAVAAIIHEGEVLADAEHLKNISSHVHVTLRKCTFLVSGAGAEAVNGFYVRRKGISSPKKGSQVSQDWLKLGQFQDTSDGECAPDLMSSLRVDHRSCELRPSPVPGDLFATMALRLAAATVRLVLALDPFYLSSEQIASLQGAAISMSVPTKRDGCTGLDEEPTDVEKDFATNAYWKYFTYDTYDPRTWVTLGDLETCLRTVPGGDENEWVGASDLWEANKLIYKQLGDTARPDQWWRQSWFEHNPVKNNDTVLGSAPVATAPISSMSTEAWEQQPCNAFSNAAFFEISLQACKTASTQNFGDFGGTWPWKNEIIAAGALMAYGSFAMHGNPASGKYHEASGSTTSNASRDMAYDTAMMDRVSMDVLFFVFFQAIVRAVARDPTDSEALKPVLGLLKHDDLAPLGCGNMYCDARDSIHLYQKILTGPTSDWHLINDMRHGIPNYELASVGLVLVAIRAIMSDELFGSAGMSAYTAVCSALVLSLMPKQNEAVWAEANYCKSGTDWYNAMKDLKWRVVKDIAKSLATLVTILESLIEGMFWQETLVDPWQLAPCGRADDEGTHGVHHHRCLHNLRYANLRGAKAAGLVQPQFGGGRVYDLCECQRPMR